MCRVQASVLPSHHDIHQCRLLILHGVFQAAFDEVIHQFEEAHSSFSCLLCLSLGVLPVCALASSTLPFVGSVLPLQVAKKVRAQARFRSQAGPRASSSPASGASNRSASSPPRASVGVPASHLRTWIEHHNPLQLYQCVSWGVWHRWSPPRRPPQNR